MNIYAPISIIEEENVIMMNLQVTVTVDQAIAESFSEANCRCRHW